MKHMVRLMALMVLMVGGLIACGGGNEVNNPNNPGGSGGSDINSLCGARCPDGQFCFNGLCVVGCNSDGDCASNQYCNTDEKQCANKTVPSCPETACGENQECVNGLCSAKSSTPPAKKDDAGACQLSADGSDGCKKYELCIEPEENKRQCRAFPPCGQGDTCPVGLRGAVCNKGYIPGKSKICLVGLCKDKSNCPTDFNCIRLSGTALGICSDGSFGQLCEEDAQCQKDLSCLKVPGAPGTCTPGGPGGPGLPGFP